MGYEELIVVTIILGNFLEEVDQHKSIEERV